MLLGAGAKFSPLARTDFMDVSISLSRRLITIRSGSAGVIVSFKEASCSWATVDWSTYSQSLGESTVASFRWMAIKFRELLSNAYLVWCMHSLTMAALALWMMGIAADGRPNNPAGNPRRVPGIVQFNDNLSKLSNSVEDDVLGPAAVDEASSVLPPFDSSASLSLQRISLGVILKENRSSFDSHGTLVQNHTTTSTSGNCKKMAAFTGSQRDRCMFYFEESKTETTVQRRPCTSDDIVEQVRQSFVNNPTKSTRHAS
ncbi:hypothetical protein J437_LFUL017167 [Ladona fulva]|uniref:Uncharacterized protein n=1 Tax=Ladona fulva TaxID=123851 RepID=A0A8K0P8I1_LADFU|nr:hypothetical protein J437_LFUL017167 [Ladona fulva]